jgi:phage/plasmid-associated DNA primase
MPQIYSKRELSDHAVNFATSFSLIRCNQVLYIPADFETGETAVTPDPDRTIWRPLTLRDVQRWALNQYNVLFSAASEEANFFFMVNQIAQQHDMVSDSLLIRTKDGLQELKSDGQLHMPSGEFVPNFIPVMLNTDEADKQLLREVFHQWLDDEEEEISLLRHLATALAPGWSAVKYILLLGDGRNGKSVLMGMLQALFGWENCSHVTRQDLAKSSPVVTEVLGKLVNIVYDGVAEYLKDSGNEKSLIAGEPIPIRMLYSSQATMVYTNALFIEGLNKEPKSSDKSSALQSRIVRFWFPNTFPDDLIFKDAMHSEQMLGALLSLMIDNFVRKEEKAVMLATTQRSQELKLEHMHANSYALQFIAHVDHTDPLGAECLIGMDLTELTSKFTSWRVSEGDISAWSEPDVYELFRPSIKAVRQSRRINGKPRKVRVIEDFKPEATDYLRLMRGEEADAGSTVVES